MPHWADGLAAIAEGERYTGRNGGEVRCEIKILSSFRHLPDHFFWWEFSRLLTPSTLVLYMCFWVKITVATTSSRKLLIESFLKPTGHRDYKYSRCGITLVQEGVLPSPRSSKIIPSCVTLSAWRINKANDHRTARFSGRIFPSLWSIPIGAYTQDLHASSAARSHGIWAVSCSSTLDRGPNST